MKTFRNNTKHTEVLYKNTQKYKQQISAEKIIQRNKLKNLK